MKAALCKTLARLGFTFAAFTAGAMLAAPAGAVPITSTPSFAVGGLQFDSFGCTLARGGFSSTTPTNCSQVDVAGSATTGGLDITSNFSAGSASFDLATVSYRVRSAAGISAIQLAFDGTFGGLSVASVTESVWTAQGQLVGLLTVSCSALGCDRQDPANGWLDIGLVGVHQELFVTKAISVTGLFGRASIGLVQQGFTTVAAEVPEPGALALLGLGGLAFWRVRRRA